MMRDRYESPLSQRYASPEMQHLWGPTHRASLWRRLWLALAEEEQSLGVNIPDDALSQMREHLDDPDLDAVAEYERRFRHDVMAHIHAFGEQAPLARPFLHLGATSAFVTDNADLILVKQSLKLLLGRLVSLLEGLTRFARVRASQPCLAYTHFQPAQLTTVGKRACLWAQDFALDTEAVMYLVETLRFRGCKGTTGTQATFLELFGGDHEKVRALDRQLSARMGFSAAFPITGQTYPRKTDSAVLDVLSGMAQSAAKLGTDLRLLQHEGEILEPFEREQIGSSAMAYKRNPMRSERVCALSRYVISLQANGAHTAAAQWLERTLDDSANRRLSLPEGFLATDAILLLVDNIVGGLEVRDAVIARNVDVQMPFMATERWLMRGVQAGGDRQTLHEVIRGESLAVTEAVARGEENTLMARLAGHDAFKDVPASAFSKDLDPAHYTGRAVQQVPEFLDEYLTPLLIRARPLSAAVESSEIIV